MWYSSSRNQRIKRFIVYVYIVAAEFLEPCTVGKRAARVLVVVEQRNLSHALRESRSQLPTRIHITKQYITDGKPASLPANHTFRMAGTFACSQFSTSGRPVNSTSTTGFPVSIILVTACVGCRSFQDSCGNCSLHSFPKTHRAQPQ